MGEVDIKWEDLRVLIRSPEIDRSDLVEGVTSQNLE